MQSIHYTNIYIQPLFASLNLINRKKEGFNAPVYQWLEEWKHEVSNELNSNASLYLKKIINIDLIIKNFDEIVKIKEFAPSIYSLYVLNKWLNIKT